MAQIAITTQVQGGILQSTAPGEGDSASLQLSGNGDAVGIPFDLALQESLAQDAQGAFLLLATQQAVAPVAAQVIPAGDGKVLPMQSLTDGKALPFASEPMQLPSSEPFTGLSQLKTTTPLPPQVEFSIQRLIAADQPMALAVALPAGQDSSKLLTEAVKLTESAGQLPTYSLQQAPMIGSAPRPTLALPLDTPVGQPGWDKAVGERIQWMVGQNIQQAEIKLTPPNLGPMEIKISLHNDQTSVSFVAAQAPTRDALEASIPRLREMLGEINLNLANVDVGHQEAGESSGERSAESATEYADESATLEWSAEAGSARVINGNGLLDTYA